jgi:hypothetical protein
MACRKIPYETEQGIFFAEQGIFWSEQGISGKGREHHETSAATPDNAPLSGCRALHFPRPATVRRDVRATSGLGTAASP